MLEYVKAGTGCPAVGVGGVRRCDTRVWDGPAQGLPDTTVGTLSQAMYGMAKQQGWTIVSMKNDWKRIFPFEK